MGDYKWIGLMRQFYNCSFYDDSNAVQMFLHIFLNAQREDKSFFNQLTMPGQFRTSIQSMTEFLQVTRKSARKSLDKLKEAGVIHVSSLRRNGVLITVRDFNKFLSLQNVRGGWVKLYYDLDFQDFFVDAKTLHLYLHILLHSYSENDRYEDPQWFDIKKISLLTGLTLKEIKEGLLRLRKYGILNVGYDGQNKLSSVRLIEFSDYMKDNLPVIGPKLSKDSTTNEGYIDADIVEYSENPSMELPCEKVQKRSNKESISGPKVNQKISSQNLHEKVTNNFVTNGKSESYNASGLKVGQKKTNNRPKENVSKTLPTDYGGNYAREHIIKENRDRERDNNYYYNNSLSQKFSSIEELVSDDEWVCSMQQLYGFSSKKTLYTALTLFLANLKCRKEVVPSSLDAFLDYFCNWYKRNASRLRVQLKVSTPLKNYGIALWEKCMSAFEKIVSERIFTSIFKQLSFESYDETTKTLLLAIPNKQLYEKLESSYIETLSIVLQKFFGKGVELLYRIQQA